MQSPAPGPEVVVDVHDLCRTYGRGDQSFQAVRGVSFTVAEGELFALLGTNGAGKTSTMELLEGLARPSAGTVRLFGRYDPFTDRRSTRPRTGAMLQEGGFSSELTTRETVQMWAWLSSRPRPVAEALDIVGLGHRADVQVKNLSGGEKRRLDLAMATLNRPDVLFLDEPTTGMDPEGRHETWRLIRRLKDQGTTIVLTTHYLEEAQDLADHLAIMHRGEIVTAGAVEEIVARHPSSLTFRLPNGVAAGHLPALPHASRVAVENGIVTVWTSDLQEAATDLLVWARGARLRLGRFNARSASLEEVFLDIARGNASVAPSADPDGSEAAQPPAQEAASA
ncbi:ABC transporter ATP-binding protein [Streptomyces sp. ACA25]|uniref:ABC transporter ATP-binding protein n=1 Tax=Streptomyces sp. ACA25 TaxID=3022596 RepID=UPI0023070D8A|nr:ABC transporter ATP-binding protein [Streptomyces sp. ACA25]MDB1085993.1 ABC transporter ATP-binding protein [Streptomyces sp. ACA25]